MPITHNIQIQQFSEEEFHQLDYRLMGIAFEAHKRLGRLCDEAIYQEFLHTRWQENEDSSATEVEIELSHEDFHKSLFMDLLLNHGVIYELKVAARLAGEHQAQLLNYLLLTGIQHGKLINFRPSSVESRFVSTRLTAERQREFSFDTKAFKPQCNSCALLVDRLEPLLRDWGVFLEASLYLEALTHLMGGAEHVIQRVEMIHGSKVLGHQPFHLINEEAAFRLTSVSKDIPGCRSHLQRLLSHTRLKTLHWINLNKHDVTVRTLAHQ